MLPANFKPKRTPAASHGFIAIARLCCFSSLYTCKFVVQLNVSGGQKSQKSQKVVVVVGIAAVNGAAC